jgi:hypothetical protein
MRAYHLAVLALTVASFLGCTVQGQSTGDPAHSSGNTDVDNQGPSTFSSNQNPDAFGTVAIVPDDTDVVQGYEAQAGPQIHFRLSRAYCDKRSNSQQSASDQANYFCVGDAVTIDDAHPPQTTPNKNFLIVPYKYGMNMDYPGGLEINSEFLGVHANHTGCDATQPFWDEQNSCHAGGNLWAEDSDDTGGVFSTAYSVANAGILDRSRSFVLIASDTYQHTSHGDMLFLLRDNSDNFRFQFGASGLSGPEDPNTYKSFTRARIDSTGKGFFDGGTQVGGADFAESVGTVGPRKSYEPGDVLIIDTTADRQFTLSQSPYSPLVAGIFSTKPGVLASLHPSEDPLLTNEVPLAVVGIVPCNVSAENGPISRGDVLVTSSTPGYAMRGTDPARLIGTIVGKALQPLPSGRGQIQVLLTTK